MPEGETRSNPPIPHKGIRGRTTGRHAAGGRPKRLSEILKCPPRAQKRPRAKGRVLQGCIYLKASCLRPGPSWAVLILCDSNCSLTANWPQRAQGRAHSVGRAGARPSLLIPHSSFLIPHSARPSHFASAKACLPGTGYINFIACLENFHQPHTSYEAF